MHFVEAKYLRYPAPPRSEDIPKSLEKDLERNFSSEQLYKASDEKLLQYQIVFPVVSSI